MQYKSQVAELVMQFIREQERTGNKIQFVRTDRGGEFGSTMLKEFFRSLGIKHIQSPAYTPQYQGKVERMNRTIGEMAHAMRAGSGLNVVFWELAWSAAIFLRNRSPASANEGFMTPFEKNYGEKPRLENLLVFGCRAEAFVESERKEKKRR